MLQTNKDKENKEIIFSLVKDHFSLDTKSLETFEKNLFDPFIDEIYLGMLNDNFSVDYRISKELSIKEKEKLDCGWEIFKDTFHEFVISTDLSYEEFDSGLVKNGTSTIKLSRYLKKYYENEDATYFNESFESFYKNKSERIGASKLPKGKVKLVFSVNFVDWFLSATAENWKSCLNLESTFEGAYWATLPGMITDRNRAMLYITNGKEKKYMGITTDRFIFRSWLLLTRFNEIFLVKLYPKDYFVADTTQIEDIDCFGKNLQILRENNSNFISKYPMNNFIKNKNGYSIFPYQDYTNFDSNLYLRSSEEGGLYCLDNNNDIIDDSPYYFSKGLTYLVETKNEIINFTSENYYICMNCGVTLTEDTVQDVNEEFYCEECFNKLFFICNECLQTFPIQDMLETDNMTYCIHCAEDVFGVCDGCGEIMINDQIHVINNSERYCDSCYREVINEQRNVGRYVSHSSIFWQ